MASIPARSVPLAVASAVVATLLGGCGARAPDGTWPLPNGDLAGTRAAAGSSIDAGNVARLEVRWRFGLTARRASPASSRRRRSPTATRSTSRTSAATSSRSTAPTGALRWARRYRARTTGRTGWPWTDERVYGATDSDAFALAAATGPELWRRHLTSASEQFVDVAPVVWNGLVFVSTVGYAPFGRGAIYALDAATGAVRWKFVTIEQPWRYPLEAGGGGLWYPVSVDARGTALRGKLESVAVGRHAGAAERRRVPRPGPVHRLADRARRAHRPAALVRPGDAARRPRLRLPGDADPRDGRGRRPRASAPARPGG